MCDTVFTSFNRKHPETEGEKKRERKSETHLLHLVVVNKDPHIVSRERRFDKTEPRKIPLCAVHFSSIQSPIPTIGAIPWESRKEMAMACYDTEKFNGRNDFGLWKIKMQALLSHQGLDEALEAIETDERPSGKKLEILKKSKSAIILNLDDKVLREVAREDSAASTWKKLGEPYMTKSLANRLYLKQRLY